MAFVHVLYMLIAQISMLKAYEIVCNVMFQSTKNLIKKFENYYGPC
jgi:hypothetical protein